MGSSSKKQKTEQTAKGGDCLSDKELFRKMIENLYQPDYDIPGQEETRQLVTSRDLQYR